MMNTVNPPAAGLALAVVLAAGVLAGEAAPTTWTFEDDATGAIARGFTNEVGRWTVVASDRGKALAQEAKNPDEVFNVTLIDRTDARDVDLTVRFQAVAGEIDQGGGLVWRARDAKNYYVARYNPLEDNFRLYKLVNGERTQLRSAEIAHTGGWHTLRVTMKGDQIRCAYDGKTYLEASDATYTGPGRIGLWTKADAQTRFDDLKLATP